VSWFNTDEGYGYITPDGGGPDVLVHWSAIRADGAPTLTEGQRVAFEFEPGQPVPRATSVVPLS
jgi:cold shock protein